MANCKTALSACRLGSCSKFSRCLGRQVRQSGKAWRRCLSGSPAFHTGLPSPFLRLSPDLQRMVHGLVMPALVILHRQIHGTPTRDHDVIGLTSLISLPTQNVRLPWRMMAAATEIFATQSDWESPYLQVVPRLCQQGQDLLSQMLCYEPSRRISARQALQHPYFQDFTASTASGQGSVDPSASSHIPAERLSQVRIFFVSPVYLNQTVAIRSATA